MALTSTEELIGIVGGAIAGLIVLLIILAVIIYCVCGKGGDKRNEKKKFQQLTSVNDASLGKNSSNGFDPRMDPRHPEPMLPKVGSSGLWLGAPSMYSKNPPDVYSNKRSSSLQRAPSESRLPQTNGHMIYQNNMHHHIYHSQQVPGVYTGHPYTGMQGNFRGLYPYNYGNPIRDSRAILVEYPDEAQYYPDYRGRYNDEDSDRRNVKVKRTHSDLTGTKRKKQNRRRHGESPSYSENKDKLRTSDPRQQTTSVEVYQRQHSGINKTNTDEQTKSLDFKDQELSSECATDSAKLRAMQQDKVKDQDITNRWKDTEELKLNIPNSDDEQDRQANIITRSYEYTGHVSNNSNKSNSNKTHESKSVLKSDASRDNVDGIARAYVGQSNPAFSHDEFRTSTARELTETPRTDYQDSHRKVERAESTADGTQVSQAFEFLDTYLSDDGTEHFESRNQSPIPF